MSGADSQVLEDAADEDEESGGGGIRLRSNDLLGRLHSLQGGELLFVESLIKFPTLTLVHADDSSVNSHLEQLNITDRPLSPASVGSTSPTPRSRLTRGRSRIRSSQSFGKAKQSLLVFDEGQCCPITTLCTHVRLYRLQTKRPARRTAPPTRCRTSWWRCGTACRSPRTRASTSCASTAPRRIRWRWRGPWTSGRRPPSSRCSCSSSPSA